MVSKIYQKNKNEPPVARDLPPIAGKHPNKLYKPWHVISNNVAFWQV